MKQHKYAIIGLGNTKMGRQPEHTGRAYEAEAVRLAIEDAGLKKEDIDGCIHTKMEAGGQSLHSWTDGFPRVLGIPSNFYFHIGRGGAMGTFAIAAACGFLEMGLANYIAIGYGTEAWSTAHGGGPREARAGGSRPGLWGPAFGGVHAVHNHSLLATRHMHEYGTTSRQLGSVAVAQRSWACLNPQAQMYGRPITIEDYLKSPFLVWPYHTLDMCLQTDGGTGIVITTAERAKDRPRPPVYVAGIGFGDMARKLWWEKQHYTQLDVEPAKKAAFGHAGIDLKDVGCFQFYDCFTTEVVLQLEGYGLCNRGEGGPFAEAGNTTPGGTVAVNTGGGLLSSHHHGDLTGIAENIRQLRGEAGARQVKDLRYAVATGHGGEMVGPGMCSVHSCLILTNTAG
ncbi:MAG: thiolase family protein [Chloroflexi bacterium]|nr:thiolase family protein [Chloroflexota bacterium]